MTTQVRFLSYIINVSPFLINVWNEFNKEYNDQPRTNKALQAVTTSHPTIRRLIECLRREEATASERLVDLRIRSDNRKKIQKHQREARHDP